MESDNSIDCGNSIDDCQPNLEVDEKFLKSNVDNLSQLPCFYSLYNRQVAKDLLDNLANTELFAKESLDASATYFLLESEVNNFNQLLKIYNKAELDFKPPTVISNIDWPQVGKIVRPKDKLFENLDKKDNSLSKSFINKMENLDISSVKPQDKTQNMSYSSSMDILTLNSIYLAQKEEKVNFKTSIKDFLKEKKKRDEANVLPKEEKIDDNKEKSFYDEFFEMEKKLLGKKLINLDEDKEK